MRCEECNNLLEELIDGELNEQASGSVTAHLASCAPCAGLHQRLLAEHEIYSSYERDIEVTPILWTRIQERISSEPVRRASIKTGGTCLNRLFGAPRLSFSVAAALVVFTAITTVATIRLLERRNVSTVPSEIADTHTSDEGAAENKQTPSPKPDPRENELQPAQVPAAVKIKHTAPPPKATPDQLVRDAEQKYVTAIAILAKDVQKRRDQLDPVMLTQLDLALTQIDRTIADTKKAMRENNNDPNALQYLLAAYSRKYEVLNELADY